jgi:hypothetical protein
MRARKMLKSQRLVVVRLDKGMRHRTVNRDAECNSGGYRRRPAEAGDITRPGGEHARLSAMRSSQTIINQLPPRGGEHHARCFGGDHGLKMEQIDEAGLDELRLR